MARVCERKIREFNQVKCIKDETEHLLVKEDEIRHKWREYFDKLFNVENGDTTFQLVDSFDDMPIGTLCIGYKNMKLERHWKWWKGGKTMGSDGTPIEACKFLEEVAIVWLTKLSNHIFELNKMPDEWRSILLPIYKNKIGIQSCINYLGIKLMNHTM
jgi:hypothetical protein